MTPYERKATRMFVLIMVGAGGGALALGAVLSSLYSAEEFFAFFETHGIAGAKMREYKNFSPVSVFYWGPSLAAFVVSSVALSIFILKNETDANESVKKHGTNNREMRRAKEIGLIALPLFSYVLFFMEISEPGDMSRYSRLFYFPVLPFFAAGSSMSAIPIALFISEKFKSKKHQR